MSTPRFTSLRFLALAVSALFFGSSLFAQVLELRWSFDADKGEPRRSAWLSGGALSIKNALKGFAIVQPANGGVSAATPGVLDASANAYDDGARITSAESPLIADVVLPQFVITLWVKPTVSPSDQPNARLFNISPAEEERGAPGLYIGLNKENLEVGMNGHICQVQLPGGGIRKGEWTFIAVIYDGFSSGPYYSGDMLTAVQTPWNAAVFIGGRESEPRPGSEVAFTTGAPNYNVTPGPFILDGLCVALGGGNGDSGHSFVGFIDEVRVYSGLMTIKQIDAVRRSSLAAK